MASRRFPVGVFLLACCVPQSVYSLTFTGAPAHSSYVTALRTRNIRLQAEDDAAASTASAPSPEAAEAQQWFEEEVSDVAAPSEPEKEILKMDDLLNTQWDIVATPREDSWLSGGDRSQQFTMLADGSVVWGGDAGGFGTGGRWKLQDGLLEVIRTTSGNLPGLSLVTGRDYYMAAATVDVNDELQFQLSGVIRSYNALYPVMVIADFSATRRPGRFVKDIQDDDDDE